MVPKPKAQLSKLSQNFYGIASQKIRVVFDQSMKNGSQMKSFQFSVITLVRGHICLFL